MLKGTLGATLPLRKEEQQQAVDTEPGSWARIMLMLRRQQLRRRSVHFGAAKSGLSRLSAPNGTASTC